MPWEMAIYPLRWTDVQCLKNFPTEHGEEFLSDWYDWETEEQPVVPDAVLPEAAGDGDEPEVPVPHGLVVDPVPLIAEPLAVVRRSIDLSVEATRSTWNT